MHDEVSGHETAGGTEWSLNKERELIEHVMNQRFNFFLIFYSLVVAGALTTQSKRLFTVVLYMGAVVTTLLLLAILRTHLKLEYVLGVIYKDPTNSTSKVSGAFNSRFSVRRLIGWIIPAICASSLWLAGALSSFSVLQPQQSDLEPRVEAIAKRVDQQDLLIRGLFTSPSGGVIGDAPITSRGGIRSDHDDVVQTLQVVVIAPPWTLLLAILGTIISFFLLNRATEMLRWYHAGDKNSPDPTAGDALTIWTSVGLVIAVLLWYRFQLPNGEALSLYLQRNPREMLPVPLLLSIPPLCVSLYKFTSIGLHARHHHGVDSTKAPFSAAVGILFALIGLAGSVATLITFFGWR